MALPLEELSLLYNDGTDTPIVLSPRQWYQLVRNLSDLGVLGYYGDWPLLFGRPVVMAVPARESAPRHPGRNADANTWGRAPTDGALGD